MKDLVIHAMGLGLIALAAATSAGMAETRPAGPPSAPTAVCDSAVEGTGAPA
ncbi:hypothetical protein [Rhodosalinus halophilus]|uniref:hypothetical protein n=1 Tax=Rhodosalinus halophilus TaxID=2259333 RepID=UPI00131413D5|nr:hypothetical protein [Rhodosalinus halophilus]